MKKMIVSALALCMGLFLVGCASTTPGLTFAGAKPVGNLETKTYQDDNIKFDVQGVLTDVNFLLTNKTSEPVKILWEDASYIDETGTSHRVMHARQRPTDRDQPQAPTVVPPGAKLKDGVAPIDTAKFKNRKIEQVELLTKKSIGKRVGLYIPILIKESKVDYLFTFDVVKSKS